MFFRNLSLFRFSADVANDLDRLDEVLRDHRLRPCGPLELATRGAVPPTAGNRDEQAPLTLEQDGFCLFCVGSEEKILPTAVVDQELAQRVQKITEEEGRPVGGKERRRLKAEVLDKLLPQAFARPGRVAGYLDKKNGWLVLDTSSRKAAEQALTTLRDALGSFPAVPLAPEIPPRQLMTQWLTSGELPEGLSLTDECELRDPAGGSGPAVVRCRNQDLETAEVREHLRNGKQVFQLGLSFDDRVGFVLGEDLVIRKLRFYDVVAEELDNLDIDSKETEVAAQFALMSREVERMLDKLGDWFNLPRPE